MFRIAYVISDSACPRRRERAFDKFSRDRASPPMKKGKIMISLDDAKRFEKVLFIITINNNTTVPSVIITVKLN